MVKINILLAKLDKGEYTTNGAYLETKKQFILSIHKIVFKMRDSLKNDKEDNTQEEQQSVIDQNDEDEKDPNGDDANNDDTGGEDGNKTDSDGDKDDKDKDDKDGDCNNKKIDSMVDGFVNNNKQSLRRLKDISHLKEVIKHKLEKKINADPNLRIMLS